MLASPNKVKIIFGSTIKTDLPRIVTIGTVFENDIQLYDLTSVSRQKYVFKLNPYTLVPNSVYMIQLSVFDTNSFLSSSKSVTVTVKNSGIVARIKDGNERTVKLGSTFFLDATLSYDLNSGT